MKKEYGTQSLTQADHAIFTSSQARGRTLSGRIPCTGTRHPDVQQDLDRARKELKDFVTSLRQEGKRRAIL